MGPLALAAIPAGIAAAGSLAGGAIATSANAKEAARNRAFQERMRATQYQTAVEDMRKAGLNPALAYDQGGAGTPGGSVMDVSQMGEGVSKATSSALQALAAKKEIALLQAQTDKANMEAQMSQAQRNQFNEYWHTRQKNGKTYLEDQRDMEMNALRLALVDASASAAESRRRQTFWDSPIGAFAPFGEFGGAAIKPLLSPLLGRFSGSSRAIDMIRRTSRRSGRGWSYETQEFGRTPR